LITAVEKGVTGRAKAKAAGTRWVENEKERASQAGSSDRECKALGEGKRRLDCGGVHDGSGYHNGALRHEGR
jgi:hypothetical protein